MKNQWLAFNTVVPWLFLLKMRQLKGMFGRRSRKVFIKFHCKYLGTRKSQSKNTICSPIRHFCTRYVYQQNGFIWLLQNMFQQLSKFKTTISLLQYSHFSTRDHTDHRWCLSNSLYTIVSMLTTLLKGTNQHRQEAWDFDLFKRQLALLFIDTFCS